jgi:mono/diheme cytochrome c family protein
MNARSLALLLLFMLVACPEPDDDGHASDDTSGSVADDDDASSMDDDSSGAGDDGGDRAQTILDLPGDPDGGAMVFAANCGVPGCHGPSGDDGVAPALSDRVPTLSPEQIVTLLLDGKVNPGSVMPSQGNLSDQALADVLAYVLATFG